MQRKKNKFNPWISYSDLFSALILMFALITILFISSIKDFEEIVGKKEEIISEIYKKFKAEKMDINIDEKTGAITISNDILFAFDSDILTERGKEEIKKKVVDIYLKTLLSDNYINYISSILIEGHADPKGDDYYNLYLSFRRALSVFDYIRSLKNEIPNGNKLDKIVKCIGRGEFELKHIDEESKKIIDYQRSRRVEIKFELNDIDELKKLLEKIRGKAK